MEDRPGVRSQSPNGVRRASQVWVTHSGVSEPQQGEEGIYVGKRSIWTKVCFLHTQREVPSPNLMIFGGDISHGDQLTLGTWG